MTNHKVFKLQKEGHEQAAQLLAFKQHMEAFISSMSGQEAKQPRIASLDGLQASDDSTLKIKGCVTRENVTTISFHRPTKPDEDG